jgi:hypothetical protein
VLKLNDEFRYQLPGGQVTILNRTFSFWKYYYSKSNNDSDIDIILLLITNNFLWTCRHLEPECETKPVSLQPHAHSDGRENKAWRRLMIYLRQRILNFWLGLVISPQGSLFFGNLTFTWGPVLSLLVVKHLVHIWIRRTLKIVNPEVCFWVKIVNRKKINQYI